jgi:hypothetical protein
MVELRLTRKQNWLVLRKWSQNYFTNDSQSVSLGIEHPCGTCDQILLPVGMLLLYKNAICTSHETHHASAIEPNPLMLFRGKPAVSCEVRLLYDWRSISQSVSLGIEHPCGTCDQILLPVGMSLLYKNANRTSHETSYASVTELNLLMLFRGNPLFPVWWGYFTTDSQSVCLGIDHPSATCDKILLPVRMFLSQICGLVSIGSPLWREDRSTIYSAITQWS